MTRFLLYKGYICQEKSFETDSLRSPSHFVYPCLLYNHIYILVGRQWREYSVVKIDRPGWLVTKGGHIIVMHRGLELYTQIAIAIFRTKYSGLWTASLYMHTYSSHIQSKKPVCTAASAQRRNGNHWAFCCLHLGFLYICLVIEKRRAHSVSRP